MFVHLRTFSEYSIQSGMLRISELVAHAKSGGGSIALTDMGNLFAVVKFYKAAKAAGVKPLIGLCLPIVDEENHGLLTLLARNESGYKRLLTLSSRHQTHLDQGGALGYEEFRSLLGEAPSEDFVLLVGLDSPWGEGFAALEPASESKIQALKARVGQHCYFAVSRLYREGPKKDLEAQFLYQALSKGELWNMPSVATQNAYFEKKEDFEAHEARVCIQSGEELEDPSRKRLFSEEQYLKTDEDMRALFSDYPQLIDNTQAVAQLCNFKLSLGQTHLPKFELEGGTSPENYFLECLEEGLKRRLLQSHIENETPYRERLEIEQKIILQMGYAEYYLIVMEFIQWAKQNGIPVGPGRGSGAGSLAAYCLGITEVDPLPFGLLFERFLNPERVSLPDFDVDFCVLGRDRVIDHVKERYGADRVAQIATHGTMKAKLVVRDVARVLGRPYALGDRLAKLIGDELGVTLDQAVKENEELRRLLESDEEASQVFELSRKLEGLVRNVGTHAGGVVIAPSALTDFTALYLAEGSVSTQLDMKDLESVGLVKFDFLGLAAITIVYETARQVLTERGGAPPSALELIEWIQAIPFDDPNTYQLLTRADTTAVFQLESSGMRELIKKMKPDTLSDIVALVALFRPGPLGSGMVDDFVNRKHGRAEIESLHESIDPLLKETYGVIVYQEQVMQIAQVLSGYTLGGADLLRRAMGKKLLQEMEKEKERFCQGAVERGASREVAGRLFELIEKFADYGFNKSHSVAYAVLAYQTAYLKAHHPIEFLAASCNVVFHDQEKVRPLIQDALKSNIKVLPPHALNSQALFSRQEDALSYGLAGVRGVGLGFSQSLVAQRGKKRPKDFLEFLIQITRVGGSKLQLQSLIKSGATDVFSQSRSKLLELSAELSQEAAKRLVQEAQGQGDIFSSESAEAHFSDAELEQLMRVLDSVNETPQALLEMEKEALGFYLTGHPIALERPILSALGVVSLGSLSGDGAKEARLYAAQLQSARKRRTKSGGVLWVAVFEDETEFIEVVLDQPLFQACQDLTRENHAEVLLLKGRPKRDEFRDRSTLRIEEIQPYSAFLSSKLKCVEVLCEETHETQLREFLSRHLGPEGVAIKIHLRGKKGTGVFTPPAGRRVKPSAYFFADATKALGYAPKYVQR